MKKAVGAGILLLAMVALSAWNVRYLDAFTEEIEDKLALSRACWSAGDTDTAAALTEEALSDWLAGAPYTHVFIRHAEVDAATDAFYELLAVLDAEDNAGAGRTFERLTAHLESIDGMEHVTAKSVF